MKPRSILTALTATTFAVFDYLHLMSSVARKILALPNGVGAMIEYCSTLLTWMFSAYLIWLAARLIVLCVAFLDKYATLAYGLIRKRIVSAAKSFFLSMEE